MAKLAEIEGIGEAYAQKLEAAGVTTIEKLLEEGASKKGRESLSEKSGISETLVAQMGETSGPAPNQSIG